MEKEEERRYVSKIRFKAAGTREMPKINISAEVEMEEERVTRVAVQRTGTHGRRRNPDTNHGNWTCNGSLQRTVIADETAVRKRGWLMEL